jgi:hemerythrin-like domain-containing protein
MSGRIPSVDGLQQIVDDHLELRTCLQEVSRLLLHERDVNEARRLVRQLINQLEGHFHREEEGGYFRDVAFRAPQLARLATSLEREHPLLLRCLSEIDTHLEECERSPRGLPKVATEFQRFATAITSHEEDEHRLIQDSYNSELGCSD